MTRVGREGRERYGSGGRAGPLARCRMCGSALRGCDAKIVVSSQAVGGYGLPIEDRLLCGRCFLEGGAKGPKRGAAARRIAVSMLVR